MRRREQNEAPGNAPRRRHFRFGRRIVRRLVRIFTLSAALLIVAFFYKPILGWLSTNLLDLSGKAVHLTTTLSREVIKAESLTVTEVTEENVMQFSRDYLIAKQEIAIRYTYTGAVTVDLGLVTFSAEGNVITVGIPPLTIRDSVHEEEIQRNDAWFEVSDARRMKLMETEQLKCREKLQAECSPEGPYWQNAVDALKGLFEKLATSLPDRLLVETMVFVPLDSLPEVQ